MFLCRTSDLSQKLISNPATGAIELNVDPAHVFKAGETNWTIPNLSQADVNAQPPSPQIID